MASVVWVCSQGPAHGGPAGTEDQEAQPPQALSVPRLQRKLKEAARKILRLRLEKEQLLELGNRLRAELGHLTGGCPPPAPPQHCLRRVVGDAGNRRAAVGGPEEGQREEGRPGWRGGGCGVQKGEQSRPVERPGQESGTELGFISAVGVP